MKSRHFVVTQNVQKKFQVHIHVVSVHTVNDMTLIEYFHISPLGKDLY